MATSDVKVTEGSGKNVATYSLTEDSETKQIQRVAVNKSDGTAMDFGSGTGGSATQRVIMDSSQAPAVGQTNQAGGVPISIPSDMPALVVRDATTYNTVAASQTAQALVGSGSGATGDFLAGLLVVPATTAAGSISILDLSTSISVFVTGTLSNLVPFFIPIGAKSKNGAWKVTTGANVSAIAVGVFT